MSPFVLLFFDILIWFRKHIGKWSALHRTGESPSKCYVGLCLSKREIFKCKGSHTSTVTSAGISRSRHKFWVECEKYVFLSEIERGIQKKLASSLKITGKGWFWHFCSPERLKMAGISKIMLLPWLNRTCSIFER